MPIENFLHNKKVDKHVKDDTIERYRYELTTITAALGKPIEKCTKKALDAYLSGLSLGDATWNHYLIVLKMYLKFHKKHTLDGVTKKKVAPKDYVMKSEYLQWLLEACHNPRDRALVLVLAKYGFRASEACSIKLSGVDFDEERTGGVYLSCTSSKTDVRKVLALGTNAIFRDWLSIHPSPGNPSAPFICNYEQNAGKALDRNMVKHFLRRIVIRAHKRHLELPLNIHAHTLRHFCTTEESKQGLSETSIKQRRGWVKNSNMLSTYLHVSAKEANEDYARQSGVDMAKVPKPLAERKCPRCKISNLPQAQYCLVCGCPMDLALAEKIAQREAAIDAILARDEQLRLQKL